MGVYVYRNDNFYNQKTQDYADNIKSQNDALTKINDSASLDIVFNEVRYNPSTNVRTVFGITMKNNEKWFDDEFVPFIDADLDQSYKEFIVNDPTELGEAFLSLDLFKINKIHINDDINISAHLTIPDFYKVWITFANSHKLIVSDNIDAFCLGFCSEVFLDVSGTTSLDEFVYLGVGSSLFNAGQCSKISFYLRLEDPASYDFGGAIKSASANDSSVIINYGNYCEVNIVGTIHAGNAQAQMIPRFITNYGNIVLGQLNQSTLSNLFLDFGLSITDTGALPSDNKKIDGLIVATTYSLLGIPSSRRFHNFLI